MVSVLIGGTTLIVGSPYTQLQRENNIVQLLKPTEAHDT